ncbi:MAG TPA: alpha/beta hydrolase [Solirubrobacterales bacterium]|nr:alpha/beta hydrolase [Solirubrobacterales bacterium]
MGAREFEVQTEDGRRLIAAVAGPEDGELLLFHPGTPSCRLLFDRHIEEGAERGLRHVIYSRPGYHGSDRKAERSYADSAADSAAVADALGVDSFYVLGMSGGGGPALACAALLPDRVQSAASVAAFRPRAPGEDPDWLTDVIDSSVKEFDALQRGEEEFLVFLQAALDGMARVEDGPQLIAALEEAEAICPADRACLEGDFLDLQLSAWQRTSRDSIWGWFDDNWAMWNEWEFDLSQITVPARIWQGGRDKLVPRHHGSWLARNTAGAEFFLREDDGHHSLFRNHYGAMLDDLIASARS